MSRPSVAVEYVDEQIAQRDRRREMRHVRAKLERLIDRGEHHGHYRWRRRPLWRGEIGTCPGCGDRHVVIYCGSRRVVQRDCFGRPMHAETRYLAPELCAGCAVVHDVARQEREEAA